MMKKAFAFLFFAALGAMLFPGCRTEPEEVSVSLPYLPGREYALYRFNDVLPHPVGGNAPDVLDGVKKERVGLSDETLDIPGFFRQSRSRSAVLISEFDAPAKGTMTFGCDADGFLKVECNGKLVLDHWEKAHSSGVVSKYNNVLTVPVRTGHNVLVFTVANGSGSWRFIAGSIPKTLLPTAENLQRLAGFLPAQGSREHQSDLLLMDQAVRATAPSVFRSFVSGLDEDGREAAYAQYPLLQVADWALQRVAREIDSVKVAPGEAVVWQLGLSGLVVKTPEAAFGIDLRHHRPELLAELFASRLDALFLTGAEAHCPPLADAMVRAGKPVYSAFYRSGKLLRSPASFPLKDLKVGTAVARNWNRPKEAVTVYRIVCGKSPTAPVLLFAGNSCSPEVLRSAVPADLFVAPAVAGARIPEAVRAVSPGLTLISGLWDAGMPDGRAFFSTDAESIRRDLRQEKSSALILLWGERLRLSGDSLRRTGNVPARLDYRDALKAPFALTGFPWHKTGEPLSRLPLSLTGKEVSDETFEQARQTAGGVIRFRTDSPKVALRASCGKDGSAVLDLYEETAPGADRLCGTLRASSPGGFLQGTLFRAPEKRLRSFAVVLPASCSLHRLEIGLAAGSQLLPPLERTVKQPVIFCGGPAVQGGSASHPGNSFSAILCRALGAPQVNLGGLSSALPALVQPIAALDPAALVLEDDAALSADALEAFFKAVRAARPELPVLLVGECSSLHPDRAAAFRRIYENALGRGDRRIRLIEGKELFAPYSPEDCCIDRALPSDLGHRLMSRRILPVLRSYFLFPVKRK